MVGPLLIVHIPPIHIPLDIHLELIHEILYYIDIPPQTGEMKGSLAE